MIAQEANRAEKQDRLSPVRRQVGRIDGEQVRPSVVLHRTREPLRRFARDVRCKCLVSIPHREHANRWRYPANPNVPTIREGEAGLEH